MTVPEKSDDKAADEKEKSLALHAAIEAATLSPTQEFIPSQELPQGGEDGIPYTQPPRKRSANHWQ